MTDVSRRAFLATGGAFAAAWLVAPADKLAEAGRYAARAAHLRRPPPFQVLTPSEAADLDAVTSQIIPTDDTPGAHEAHVVYFLDKSLATWAADQLPHMREGIAELRARAAKLTANGMQAGGAAAPAANAFVNLGDDQRRSIVASLESDKHPFFQTIQNATVVGMLAHPEYGGNFNKTGWKMIGFVDQFSWAAPFGWYDAHPNG